MIGPDPADGPGAASGGSGDSVERYVPGAMVAGRYRIVAILGRGGMGEVYRADDLTLGQPVALKFLPEALARNEERLAMLLEEVRVARRVAHPNTCRVYDVGEHDGHSFITMEYVDGEDLATLLRRIGHLSGDKAVQIAREICAGLAAAHEQGIVHRDFKPANIMIDGRGRARVTDFGLAREAAVIDGPEAGAGTPAYMAPEQLAGREATSRSDIYALGLVLYELFTGQRPFAARSRADAISERSSGPPAEANHLSDTVDPMVEAVILRCLAPEPTDRPGSAAQVAAALPGGDPLAAALAAGETPSPELVAAAPAESTLNPAIAAGGVLFCLVALLAGQWLQYRYLISPDGRQPVVLADRAAEILRELGHPVDGHDEAWGYGRPAMPAARPLFDAEQAAQMARAEAPPYFTFWYRSAPETLMPLGRMAVSPNDPPRARPGSALVQLDTDGDLVGLEVWPDPDLGSPGTSDPPWDRVLELAGLEDTGLRPVRPGLAPMFATQVAAWEGSYPGGLSRRVEAAALDGQLVWMRVFSPEIGDPGLVMEALPPLFLALLYLLFAIVIVGGLWLARSNLRSGRGDSRGAARVALAVAFTWLIALSLRADHSATVAEFLLIYRLVSTALFVGAVTAAFYLGLEPLLRRHWPHRIVGWARAIEGRFLDPLVGRDLFVAAVACAGALHLDAVVFLLGQALRGGSLAWTVLIPEGTGWQVADILAGWPLSVSLGILQGLGVAVLLLMAVRVVHNDVIGAVVVTGTMVFGLALRDQIADPALLLGTFLQVGVFSWLLLRYGLLALVSVATFANLSLMYPTARFADSWLANGSTALILTIPLVAAYGAWVATRNHSTTPPAASTL